MGRTLQELKAQTSIVRENPSIVDIVSTAPSAQEAERRVAELEFPTPILREARLLWKLSEEYPEAFRVIQAKRYETGADSDIRTFSVSYNAGTSPYLGNDLEGILIVKRHPVLPPIFWDYTLLDDEAEEIYSTQKGVGEKYKSSEWRKRVECTLAHGSRSLPASLRICFTEKYDGYEIEFVVARRSVGCSPAYTNTFTWTRHIITSDPRQSRTASEWYERTTSHSERGAGEDRVVFRKLAPDEIRSFHEYGSDEKTDCWVLGLETAIDAPVGQKSPSYIPFILTTVYEILYTKWQNCKPGQSFPFRKVESMFSLMSKPGMGYFTRIPFIVHGDICDHSRPMKRTTYKTVEAAVYDISQHTPPEIDGLATLWNLFGFKKTDQTYIYNLSMVEEIEKRECRMDGLDILPLWRPKK